MRSNVEIILIVQFSESCSDLPPASFSTTAKKTPDNCQASFFDLSVRDALSLCFLPASAYAF